MKKNEKIHISGMHCVSCEVLLEKALKQIKWVSLKMISHKKWIMEIEYSKESEYEKVIQAIEKNGFSLSESKNKNENTTIEKIMINVIVILFVIILLMFSSLFDIAKFLPNTSTLSYSGAFLVGLIASVSTCLAITGWIVIGFSKYIDKSHSWKWHIKVQLWFQIWRILWFFLLWWLLWMTGNLINMSLSFTSIFTLIIWVLLLYMWLNILWILPSFSKFWIHMPKSFVSKVEALGKPKYAPLAWALTFFLPCWFTQTIQLLAVSSGSFFWWGLVMLFFALWTFPVLFSVGLGSSYFNDKKFPLFQKFIAALLLFFGTITIINASNLISFSVPNSKENVSTSEMPQSSSNEVETIKMWHNWWSTVPEQIVLEKGKNYKVVITPEKNGMWCMATQAIPKIQSKVSYVIQWKDIVYEFNNAVAGTYEIVCASMGMSQGRIIIK